MPSRPLPTWRSWHDDDQHHRCRSRRALAERTAVADLQADVGPTRLAIRQGRLAGGPLPRGARQARDGRPWSAAHRTPSRRGASARRQNAGHLRLRAVPMVSKAQVMALASGDAWLAKGANILLFGPPGGGKSHLSAALGLALVENGWRVMFARTTDLVQRLQVARRELALESTIAKLDRYDLLILDDLAYVTKDQAETSVLFELIAARYERRSMLITANQPFGEWDKIFPDQAMTLAAIDRLVHHATILEMNVESYRRREALDRKRGRGRPSAHATIKKTEKAEAD